MLSPAIASEWAVLPWLMTTIPSERAAARTA
jgi:hypothetical protein